MYFKRYLGLLTGAIAAAFVMLVPISGLGYPGHAALGLLIFAIAAWSSESVPLPVSSLIVLLIQPLAGIVSFGAALTGFANPVIFLLLGGFIIAEGVAVSGLVDRVANEIMSRFGSSSGMILLGAVLSTGMLSAWINNLVAYAVVLPVVKHIISTENGVHPEIGNGNFARKLVLGASHMDRWPGV